MKFEPLTWADLQDTGNAQSQLVLIAVARHADWDTGACYPSVRAIADMSKCSEKTARRHLKQLKADGFIELEERFAESGEQTSNLITLCGYAEWVVTLRTGGGVARPKRAKRYRDDEIADAAEPLSGAVSDARETSPPPGQSDHPPLVNLTSPPGHVLTSPPGHLVTRPKELSLEHSIELSPQPPGASEGEREVDLIVRVVGVLPAGTEHTGTAIARIATTIRVDHDNRQALFSQLATELRGYAEPELDAIAREVIRSRKKIVSPKCVLDCVKAALETLPTVTIREGDPRFEAWAKHYANKPAMLSLGRKHGFAVRSNWPPGYASRAVPAAPGAPAGARSPRGDAAPGRALALGSDDTGGAA